MVALIPVCQAKPVFSPALLSPNTSHILNDLAEGVAQSKLTGKPLLVLLGMNWCPHTQVIREELRTEPGVQSALNDFVVVEIVNSPAERLVSLLGTNAYPTLVAYAHTGKEIWRVVGETDGAGLANGLSSVMRIDRGDAVQLANVQGDTSAAIDAQPHPPLSAAMSQSESGTQEPGQDDAQATTVTHAADGSLTMTSDFGALSLAPKILRPNELITNDGEIVHFVFDAAGTHVLKAISHGGAATEVSYAASGKLESLISRPATPDELATAGFDPVADDQNGNTHVSVLIFKYDDKSRLTAAHYDEGTTGTEQDAALLYGVDGRIASITDNSTHAVLDLIYDGPGDPHRVHVITPDGTTGDVVVKYDSDGSIESVEVVGGDNIRKIVVSTFKRITGLVAMSKPEKLRSQYIFY